ncbi:MAG: VOC family protein [Candidatus Heimdallarchaeota archaeon]
MAKKKKNPILFERMYFQIKVADIERAKKFYEDTFNFNISWYMSPEVGWCEFDLPGGTPRLGLNTVAEDDKVTSDSGTFTISVKNLEQTKKYLEDKGIATTDITDIPNMVSYFNMTDSEGNRVQIVSEPRLTE